MPPLVVMGAQIKCSGAVPPGISVLTTIPKGPPTVAGAMQAATIMDNVPLANIMTFGMCMMPANPVVAAATTAAAGVLTPMPCVPVTPAPWTPGSPTVLINNFPALSMPSTLMCTWGGVITVLNPGQFQTQVP